MYEETTPFGGSDTDETTIFKRISSFRTDALPFTDKSPTALKIMLQQLLAPAPQQRLGYLLDNAIRECTYFAGK
jgi:hypothetical protein